MNIIFFTKQRGWQRQLDLDLKRPVTAALFACALALVVGSIFAAGFAGELTDGTAAGQPRKRARAILNGDGIGCSPEWPERLAGSQGM